MIEKYRLRLIEVWVEWVTRERDERGDVPGWVMITLMTAAIVAGLTSIAVPQFKQMLSDAIGSVSGG